MDAVRVEDATPQPAGDRRWMLHVDEPTRASVLKWLTCISESLATIDAPRWRTTSAGAVQLDVPRALKLRGRWVTARLRFTNGTFMVHVVDPRKWAVLPFEVWGEGPEASGTTEATALALDTLAFWRDGLAEPNDPSRVDERERFRTAAFTLLRGVVARLPVAWRRIEFDLDRDGEHTLRLWLDGDHDERPIVFTPQDPPDFGPRMSDALARELDRLAGEWIHVSILFQGRHDDLPLIQIGAPDTYSISRCQGFADPIERLRAAASTPDDVGMIWPND